MSKKCPYCGSYNTELSVPNYAKRAAINIAIGAALITSAFNPSVGHASAHAVIHNTDPGELRDIIAVTAEKIFLHRFTKHYVYGRTKSLRGRQSTSC